MCWHRWTKWGDRTVLTNEFKERIGYTQYKECTKCGKLKRRKVT